MKSFRNPEYLERYEDVVFDLEQALATPANDAHQTKTGHRFVADNTGEATPFDWYNARFSVDFKVNQLAAGANIDADGDQMGIANGSSSLIEKLSIMANGRDVYRICLSIILPMLIVLLQMNFTILIQQDMLKEINTQKGK